MLTCEAFESPSRRAILQKIALGGGAMLLWSSPTEQDFQTRIFGDTTRDLLDFEGLTLVHVPGGPAEKRKRAAGIKARAAKEGTTSDKPMAPTPGPSPINEGGEKE